MMWFTAAAIALAMTPGCGAPQRQVQTDARFAERSAADLRETSETFNGAITSLLSRAEGKVLAAGDTTPTMDVLAMSGGGDYGAFGAGVLVGWGSITDPQYKRPDFDVVTGVSTGALLAPFAYVGTDEACMAVEHLYRHPKKDWVKDNGLLYFLPFNPSFMQIPGLERDIRASIDRDMIAKMAEQSRKGKVLAISSTDLDLGRQKFWDVGVEAEKAVRTEDYEKVHRIMLASAAIPAIFPPIEIDDSIYGDGGVSANVFLRLDPRNPNSFVLRWMEEHPGRPMPKIRYWIVINNQLSHIPKTVQRKWPAVIGPSLEIAIRSATLAEVRWLAAEADYTNLLLGANIEVRVLAIPDDWRPPVEGQFQEETMQSLAQVGRSLGERPGSWKLLVTPEMSRGKR